MNETHNAEAIRKTHTSLRGKVTQTIDIFVDGELVGTLKGKAEVRKGWVWAARHATTGTWATGASARYDLATGVGPWADLALVAEVTGDPAA